MLGFVGFAEMVGLAGEVKAVAEASLVIDAGNV